jgi:uncharacterized protein
MLAAPGFAQQIPLAPLGEREFVLDTAQIFSEDDERRIGDACAEVMAETAVSIKVVTISSMSDLGFAGWRIETFARTLFDQWGIGKEKHNGRVRYRGILLLVSRDDRTARIELGADWGRAHDGTCQSIMDAQMLPAFESGAYADGIALGVSALHGLARAIGEDAAALTAAMPVDAGDKETSGFKRILGVLPSFMVIPLLFWFAYKNSGHHNPGGKRFRYYGNLHENPRYGAHGSGSQAGGNASGGSRGGFSGGGGATGSW